MGLLKRKTQEKVQDDLNHFEIVGKECRWCGHGPVIRYEPEQFKVQCWTCRRVFDKADLYIGFITKPDSHWIEKKLGCDGKPLEKLMA